jgi:uncharacterized membrane protein
MTSLSAKPLLLITGSSGLIGFTLTDRSAERFTVVGFDRPGAPHPPPSADNVPVDLTSNERVLAGLRSVRDRYGLRIASVVHLAAYFDFSGDASPLYDQVAVQGTRHLLRGLHDLHFDAERDGRKRYEAMTNPSVPPGWSYNPSIWGERLWLIGVALLGFAISAYLAAYQWELFDGVWEPLFGSGSQEVLHSFLSKLLPIPDAALGAFAYALDAVAGAIGGTQRWRTMPWMVLLFGLAVGPLGIVSVLLIISQPVLLGAWCTMTSAMRNEK